MARTPLARWVRDAGPPGPPRLTRRTFLRKTAALGGTVAGAAALGRAARAGNGPRIVVVGAGLAGLTCAYRLRQAGFAAEVHEASSRVGGRCWTIRGAFADGQIAEHGGELIDTGHVELRRLARELGLELDDLHRAEARGAAPFFRFGGAAYPEAQARAEIQAPWAIWAADTDAAGYPTTFDGYTPRGFELDHLSIAEYVDQTVPGGLSSRLGQLLATAYTIEYGAEVDEQSALNFLYLIGFTEQTELALFGESDERFHIRGGNDQVAQRLADRLRGQIVLGSELVAVERRPDRTVRLTFAEGSRTRTVTADKAVLALPFSILRSSVDLSRAGFSRRKLRAIAELGMGTNAKLQLQFDRRHWERLGCNGDTLADTWYQNTWDVTRAQRGRAGILVDYTGGDTDAHTPQQFLQQLEAVLPGISARWNGKATLDRWVDNPWTKGSYSYWKVGQYTDFAGVEGRREGNCHFAGEHTSTDFQGYLNGAVQTGQSAAQELIAGLR
jgi:monoamine oxidase